LLTSYVDKMIMVAKVASGATIFLLLIASLSAASAEPYKRWPSFMSGRSLFQIPIWDKESAVMEILYALLVVARSGN